MNHSKAFLAEVLQKHSPAEALQEFIQLLENPPFEMDELRYYVEIWEKAPTPLSVAQRVMLEAHVETQSKNRGLFVPGSLLLARRVLKTCPVGL